MIEKFDKSGTTRPGARRSRSETKKRWWCRNLAGQTVRSVTEACSRTGLVPALIGSGVALEQSVEAGTQVLRGTRLDRAVRTRRGSWCRRRRREWELRFVMERERLPRRGTKRCAASWRERVHGDGKWSLAEVLDGIAGVRVSGPSDPSVRSIAYDSRKVTAGGDVFCAAWRESGWQSIREAMRLRAGRG